MQFVLRAAVAASALFAISLFASVPAFTEPTSAPAEQAAADAAPEKKPHPNARICKRVKTTGTHFPKKMCLRQREWDELRADSQRQMDRVNSAGGGGGPT